MYDRAYQICQDKALIKPYLYASYKYMSLEEYHILITKQDEYMEINAQMRREIDEIRKNMRKRRIRSSSRSGNGSIEEIIHKQTLSP